MDGKESTIAMLERLSAMRDRARFVAAKVKYHVTYALSGTSWPPQSDDKPAIRLLDAGQSGDSIENDRP